MWNPGNGTGMEQEWNGNGMGIHKESTRIPNFGLVKNEHKRNVPCIEEIEIIKEKSARHRSRRGCAACGDVALLPVAIVRERGGTGYRCARSGDVARGVLNRRAVRKREGAWRRCRVPWAVGDVGCGGAVAPCDVVLEGGRERVGACRPACVVGVGRVSHPVTWHRGAGVRRVSLTERCCWGWVVSWGDRGGAWYAPRCSRPVSFLVSPLLFPPFSCASHGGGVGFRVGGRGRFLCGGLYSVSRGLDGGGEGWRWWWVVVVVNGDGGG
ncbi:hypothetical protein CPC08DRAFT_755669 [Agrocybe pediades]|nr:hypothetical protein CPC08DRAFT_755669 [Agrocybe pediades]